MIKRLSHATIYVKDQDRAKAFYVDKLGFVVRTDQKMGDFRWLTVGPKDQPDMEIVLMSPGGGSMFDDETAAKIIELMDLSWPRPTRISPPRSAPGGFARISTSG